MSPDDLVVVECIAAAEAVVVDHNIVVSEIAANIRSVGEAAVVAGKAVAATATVAEAVVGAAIAAETAVDIAIVAEDGGETEIVAEVETGVRDDVLDVEESHSLSHDLYKKQA